MPNIEDLTPPDDDFKPGEIPTPAQHFETAEELTALMQQLKAVAATAIADIQRCRDMLEAEGQYKKAADCTIKLLPYILKQKGALDEIASGSLFAEFNISYTTKRDVGAMELGAEFYRASRDLPPNLSNLDAKHAVDLWKLYHDITGHYSCNGETLMQAIDIDKLILTRYGHAAQAKAL